MQKSGGKDLGAVEHGPWEKKRDIRAWILILVSCHMNMPVLLSRAGGGTRHEVRIIDYNVAILGTDAEGG